ncbi:MAG TPA: hemolysin family protein [Pseudobacteroides sp.]|nr:hemolysin family protein [Pseudobacteroides sp.]
MFAEIMFLIVLILLNAFFAASEIALISLNDNKIKLMAEEGNKKAGIINKLLKEPSKFLATIQIGITLAGFLASAFAAESFSGRLVDVIKKTGVHIPDVWLRNTSVVIITIILSYFTLVLGELVPKRLAMKKAESISMFAAGPLNFLSVVTSPFVKFLTYSTNFFVRLFGVNPNEKDEKVTEEEIRMMVDVGEENGSIHEIEKEVINNIFDFDNKTVTDIMTHRTDIGALPVDATFEEVVSFINKEKYSRIPVYEDNIDNIVGVLHAKYVIQYLSDDEARKNFNIRDITRRPYFVPDSKRTDELFKEMQKNNTHMAVIIDEFGGTAGIITLEDLIEAIVGNIFDEDDEVEKDIDKLDENTYIINGTTSLYTVRNYLDVELPTEDYETLGGFIVGQLGRIPDNDDKPSVEFDGFVFKVEEVHEKRVSKVKVCKA